MQLGEFRYSQLVGILLTAKYSVPVTLKIHPGQPHAFILYPDMKATKAYYRNTWEWMLHLSKT